MIELEGTLLTIALVLISMAIVAFVLFVRYRVKKEPNVLEILFGEDSTVEKDNDDMDVAIDSLYLNDTDGEGIDHDSISLMEAGDNSVQEQEISSPAPKKSRILGLFSMFKPHKEQDLPVAVKKRGFLDSILGAINRAPAIKEDTKDQVITEDMGITNNMGLDMPDSGTVTGEKQNKPGFLNISGIIGSLFNRRTNSQKMEEIDQQLNNVLMETQSISNDIKPPQPMMDIATKGESITDLDKAIKLSESESSMPAPGVAEPQEQLQIKGTGQFNISSFAPTPGEDITVPEPEPETTVGFDIKDDILSELEETTKVEKDITLDIMRDLKDQVITCEDLEKDLTEVLEKLRNNTKRSENNKVKV